jgi:phosphohistidine phosphatase
MQSSANTGTTQPDSANERQRAGMRRLIRHAKAVEDDVGGDHARSLSPRGLTDAQQLGEWLKAEGLVPDVALCSTAIRTRQTLAALGNNLPTILSDKLYLASLQDMLSQIQATDDAVETLMVVAHNPGSHALLAHLAGSFAHEADADRMLLKFPTSACAVMEFAVDSWKDVVAESGRLVMLRG